MLPDIPEQAPEVMVMPEADTEVLAVFGPFGGFYGQYTNQNQQTTETEEDIHLRAAANYLNSGHYKEALNVLSGIKDRSARWYYYSSIANSGMGNNVLALEHAKEALRLEPSKLSISVSCQPS